MFTNMSGYDNVFIIVFGIGILVCIGLLAYAGIYRVTMKCWPWQDIDSFTESDPADDDDDWIFDDEEYDDDDDDDDDDDEFDEEWDSENLADKTVNNFWTNVYADRNERVGHHTAIADTGEGVEFVEVMPDHYSDDYFANQIALNEIDMLVWEKEQLNWLLAMRHEASCIDRELASV